MSTEYTTEGGGDEWYFQIDGLDKLCVERVWLHDFLDEDEKNDHALSDWEDQRSTDLLDAAWSTRDPETGEPDWEQAAEKYRRMRQAAKALEVEE